MDHFEVPSLQKAMPELYLQNLFKRSHENVDLFKRNADFATVALAAAKDLEKMEKDEYDRELNFNRIYDFIDKYEKAEI